MAEVRVLVTQNARDFRRLIGKTELHPGLIILPGLDRETTWRLLTAAIAYLELRARPMDEIVNHVLEIDAAARFTFIPLPKP